MWTGLSTEVSNLSLGLQTVADSLEALNARLQRYVVWKKGEMGASSNTPAKTIAAMSQCCLLVDEYCKQIGKLNQGAQAVVGDVEGLCAVCEGETDDAVVGGTALAAFAILFEQLAAHYGESSLALRQGNGVVRQVKGHVVSSNQPNKNAGVAVGTAVSASSTTAAALAMVSGTHHGDEQGSSPQPPAAAQETVGNDGGSPLEGRKKKIARKGLRRGGRGKAEEDGSGGEQDGDGYHESTPTVTVERFDPCDQPLARSPADTGYRHATPTTSPSASPTAYTTSEQGPKLRKRKFRAKEDETSSYLTPHGGSGHNSPSHLTSEEDLNALSPQQTEAVLMSKNPSMTMSGRNDSLAGSATDEVLSATASERQRSLATRATVALVTAPLSMTKYVAGKTVEAVRSSQESLLANHYPDIARDEELMDIANCALMEGKVLKQGYWFLTRQHFVFIASVLHASICLRFDDIREISKKKTAVIFDNAIQVETMTGEVFFLTSFLKRDESYKKLHSLWAC